MRFVRIFLLHLESVLEYRTTNLVWFLISLINPFTLLVYWLGYYGVNNASTSVVVSITTYYFLLIIVGSLLMTHIEDHVAYRDIQMGELTQYLLKPFSYLWLSFFQELPWRLIQAVFGIVVLGISLIYFKQFVSLTLNLQILIATIVIWFLAYILSFYFKMVVGLSAFWLVEFSGFSQMIQVIILGLAGYIMPLDLYPETLKNITYLLPFSYMIYFPVEVVLGKLDFYSFVRVMLMQLFWISFFVLIFKFLWKKGIEKFTGLGN